MEGRATSQMTSTTKSTSSKKTRNTWIETFRASDPFIFYSVCISHEWSVNFADLNSVIFTVVVCNTK